MVKKKRALVLYSRIPSKDMVAKTRIGKALNNQALVNVFARTLIWDIINEYLPKNNEYDFIYYHKGDPQEVKEKNLNIVEFIEQIPGDISMGYIHQKVLQDYQEVIVVGSDIPCLKKEMILGYFEKLSEYDITICPVRDGGYGLVGMKKYIDIYSDIDNWDSRTLGYRLLEHTLQLGREKDVQIYLGQMLFDLDTANDIRFFFNTIAKNGKIKEEYLYLQKTFDFIMEHKETLLSV